MSVHQLCQLIDHQHREDYMKTISPIILELEEAQVKAFNDGDLDKIMDFFYPDIVGFSSTKHERISGLQAMRQTFEYYLSEADKIDYSIKEPTVQVFGDAAIITFYWTVIIHAKKSENKVEGRGSHVYAKIDGDWKLVHEHFSRAHHHV